MRMAVMGAGSLGTIVGALVTRGGYEIDLIDVNVDHVRALNANGAKITGLMEELVKPVKAITPDEMTGEYDVFFYLTKTTQNESALQHVVGHLKPDGVVVCMQNGIPEDAVAEQVGQELDRGLYRRMGGPGWSRASLNSRRGRAICTTSSANSTAETPGACMSWRKY